MFYVNTISDHVNEQEIIITLHNIEDITCVHMDVNFIFECSSVQLEISPVSAANEWDIKLNTQREIPSISKLTHVLSSI